MWASLLHRRLGNEVKDPCTAQVRNFEEKDKLTYNNNNN